MTGKVLLKDVIAIPERAGTEDYVLKLTEGVGTGRLDDTINDYVVTEDLAKAFGDALDLVAAGVSDGASRASFLSGSFGSGKSHFMAVLYALLGHNATARAKTELQSVIAAHDPQLEGKKILRLAFHFLDAQSIEQCVLGGYVQQIGLLHPDAPLPAVHKSDELLKDAENLRAQMGEDVFLAGLNKAGGEGGAAGSVWRGYALWLELLGYSVWYGNVQAEQFGVPQTRKRAMLLASRTRNVTAPRPTHSRYYARTPGKLDPGVAPWVSMAEAPGQDWRVPGDLRSEVTHYGDVRRKNGCVRPLTTPAPTITASMDNGNFGFTTDPAST